MRDRDVLPDDRNRPVRLTDRAVTRGEPRRHRRDRGRRSRTPQREHADHRREARETVVRPTPEDCSDDERREEMRQVDEPRGVVPPAEVGGTVPECVLQPNGRDRLAEERRLDLDLRAARVRGRAGRPRNRAGGRRRRALPMNGDQSITRRDARRRRSVTENETMPTANQKKTRSCDVGTPTVKTIAADARAHATGAPIRSALSQSTGRTLELSGNGDDHFRPRAADRRRERSRPANGSRFARPTRARSSAGSPSGGAAEARARARRRRSARCASRCPRTSARESSTRPLACSTSGSDEAAQR